MNPIGSNQVVQAGVAGSKRNQVVGSAAGSGGPEPGAPRPQAATLDGCRNNVTCGGGEHEESQVVGVMISHRRCGRRFCPKCGKRLGVLIRDRLIERAAGKFRWPGMLTLTTGRGELSAKRPDLGFASPEVAYDHVRNMRYIPRLMSKLGIRRWVWVLEFQRDGWPHWHVLFDRGELGGGRLDYEVMHRWWRDVWKVGLAKDSGIRFDNPEGAILYVTEYLVKHPEHGYPEWVWRRRVAGHRGTVRCIQSSREVGALLHPSEQRESELAEQLAAVEDFDGQEDDGQEVPEGSRRYADIVADCGTASVVTVEVMTSGGELRRKYLGELPCSPGALVAFGDSVQAIRRAVGLGENSDAWVAEEVKVEEWGERRWLQVRAPKYWVQRFDAIAEELHRLERERPLCVEVPLTVAAGLEDRSSWGSLTAEGLIDEARRSVAAYLAERGGVQSC